MVSIHMTGRIAQCFRQYLRATNCYKLSDLILPCEQSREPQRAEGAPRNTPPKSSWLSPIVGTREIPGRMIRMVEVGRREPYENPIPSWEVGRGIVVGARESRV